MLDSTKNKKVRSIVQMLKDKGVPSFFSDTNTTTEVSPSGVAEATESTGLGDLIMPKTSMLDKNKVDGFYEKERIIRNTKPQEEPEVDVVVDEESKPKSGGIKLDKEKLKKYKTNDRFGNRTG
jgi:hypothetical protein